MQREEVSAVHQLPGKWSAMVANHLPRLMWDLLRSRTTICFFGGFGLYENPPPGAGAELNRRAETMRTGTHVHRRKNIVWKINI